MGEPVSGLGPVKAEGGGIYDVVHPPRPNPAIVAVGVVAYPSTGVCKIIGETETNEDDPAATAAKQQVEDLVKSLSTKYGPPTQEVTECDDADGRCSSLLAAKIDDHSARYGYQWNLGETHRPDHIGVVSVAIVTASPVSTHATVGYASDRDDACDKAAAAAGADGL
jgi:hypothetical protein